MGLTKPTRAPEERTGNEVRPEPPYNVILHNSWHPMTYVVYVLKKSIPGLTLKKATKIMLTAHREGRAVAKSCHKELAELYEERLKAKGLRASIEPGA
ncbi:MAG: ATP-dependent Clp protease adaptor ClpS [Rubrobacteraceae bacterium]